MQLNDEVLEGPFAEVEVDALSAHPALRLADRYGCASAGEGLSNRRAWPSCLLEYCADLGTSVMPLSALRSVARGWGESRAIDTPRRSA